MNKEKKRQRRVFPWVLVSYALIFLIVAGLGLRSFWNYIDAYEQSRAHVTLERYMQTLTAESVCDNSGKWINQADLSLQSEESCRQVIIEALHGEFRFAKKSNLSTENKQIYAILCDKTPIGTLEMERRGQENYGFIPWEITNVDFNLSYLITPEITVTVPEEFQVYVNGIALDEDDISETQLPYPLLQEFYEGFCLPYQISYKIGPFLGNPEVTVFDAQGNPVTVNEDTDLNQFLNNCTPEEIEKLDSISDLFIHSYVDFTSNKDNSPQKNYAQLAKYMVSGGDLAKRMQSAFDGLSWVSDRKAKLTSLDIHNYVNVGENRYFCDLTYKVDTRDYAGTVESVNRVKIIFLATANGLRAETMISY